MSASNAPVEVPWPKLQPVSYEAPWAHVTGMTPSWPPSPFGGPHAAHHHRAAGQRQASQGDADGLSGETLFVVRDVPNAALTAAMVVEVSV